MYLSIEERTKYKNILKDYNLMKAKVKGMDLKSQYLRNNNNLDIDKDRLLTKEMKEYKEVIEIIDIGFKRLSALEIRLIELRYLDTEKLTWVDIGDKLNLSEGYCRTKLHEKCLIKIFNLKNNKIKRDIIKLI